MKVLILKEQEMKQVFTMREAIEADKEALQLYVKGACTIPLRVNLDVAEHQGQSLFMPGYVPAANALGVKIVSVYPENKGKGLTNVPGTMVLLNHETGEVCCIMDGTCLTRLRTGAVAGAATDALAPENSQVFALFGTGGQAESQLEAVLSIRPIQEVRIFSPNAERRESFTKRMEQLFGQGGSIRFIAASSPEEAIHDADIITAVTTSKKPVFDGSKVKKSAHINGVGSYNPHMQEIDEYILTHANKLYCDTPDAMEESADFIIPLKKGSCKKEKIRQLGEVFTGKAPGRESPHEMTFFKTAGSAVLDVVVAQKIYEAALKSDVGQIIEF